MGRTRAAILVVPLLALVACENGLSGPAPVVGPEPPSLRPGIVCRQQRETPIAVQGRGFSPLPVALPGDPRILLPDLTLTRRSDLFGTLTEPGAVRFSGDGEGQNADRLSWQSTSQMTVRIDQSLEGAPGGILAEGLYDLEVENPNGTRAAAEAVLGVLSRPVLEALSPPMVCLSQGPRTVRAEGAGFLAAPEGLPTLTAFGALYAATAVEDCRPLAHGNLQARLCGAATFELSEGEAPEAGAQAVFVTNPEGAACHSEEAVTLEVVPPPVIEAVDPALVCTAQGGRSLTVRGQGFLEVEGILPTATLDGEAVAVLEAAQCEPAGAGVRRCAALVLQLPQIGATEVLEPALVIQNPDPIGCAGTASALLALVPPPIITSVERPAVCTEVGDAVAALLGTGFLVVEGAGPAVTVNDTTLAADRVSASQCTPLSLGGAAVERCERLLVRFDSAQGEVRFGVVNPAPAGCGASWVGALPEAPEAPAPTLTSITPTSMCPGGGPLVLHGTRFTADTEVAVGQSAQPQVTSVSETALEVEVAPGLASGTYDVSVSNGPGCTAVLPGALEIEPQPFVFFVDPPVTYDGIAVQATVYTSGLTTEASEVRLLGPSGQIVPLPGTSVPGEPNRIFVTLPASLPAGRWDLEVASEGGCVDVLQGALLVTRNLALPLESVDPHYVSSTRDTAVTIKTVSPIPTDRTGFQPTPSAYLNPVPARPGAVAKRLRAVVQVDKETLTAVVPANLPAGTYALIVVNPDATVGVLADGLAVSAQEPPRITSVVPGSLASNAPQTARILGEDFDPAGVAVEMRCREPNGTELAPASATVSSVSTTAVDASFPSQQFSGGTVCIIRLTNTDGAYFDYSAISIRTPAQNLYAWSAGRPMVEGRQGLGLVAGRPTDSSRYLFAVGGDDARGVVRSSVESVAVDVFGGMADWRLQRNDLGAVRRADGSVTAEPRTFAGVLRIGQFVYAVGGSDGVSAQSTLLRAQILDPLATPEVRDLSIRIGGGARTWGGGFFYYRVSALFPEDDPSNPGGESLPGEVLVVQLPTLAGLELTLTWDPVPGASGYRVYRTPAADQSPVDVELVAEIEATSWLDQGEVSSGVLPLPAGSLGVWHEPVESPGAAWALSRPRQGIAVAAAPDPSVPGRVHLYAFGGRDGGTYLDTYEYFTLDVIAPAGPDARETQEVIAHALGTGILATARARIGTWTVTHSDMSVVPDGRTWIYVGPGVAASGDVRTVDAALVPAGGDLLSFTAIRDLGSRTGAGLGDGNGRLFVFGGGNGGTPSANGNSAEVCTSSGTPGCSGGPPLLVNWNSLGVAMTESRAFMGAAQESAFFFAAGGFNGTIATRSVDQTVK